MWWASLLGIGQWDILAESVYMNEEMDNLGLDSSILWSSEPKDNPIHNTTTVTTDPIAISQAKENTQTVLEPKEKEEEFLSPRSPLWTSFFTDNPAYVSLENEVLGESYDYRDPWGS